MKTLLLLTGLALAAGSAAAGFSSTNGLASWYGEAHRGRTMADGAKFNPDKLTAASWFYPLGTRVRVANATQPGRSVVVTITDRGPAKRLVRKGRMIDLSRAAFQKLASPEVGLVSVSIDALAEDTVVAATDPPGTATEFNFQRFR